MGWLAVLGLISLLFIFAGCTLAMRRIRRYREDTETRRARAFAEMAEIGKNSTQQKPFEEMTERPFDKLKAE